MLLELKNVRKEFGGIVAVQGVSFSVKKGEIFGIIGPNGAGKTTLFNLITGVYPLTEGSISLAGEQIDGLKPHQIVAAGISRTFQNIRLFKQMTTRENLMVGKHQHLQSNFLQEIFKTRAYRQEEAAAIEESNELLKLVNLEDQADDLAGSLAYGDQRRLEIMRALGAKPQLILLDEPAAGMNESESAELMDLILSLRDWGATVIVIEHDMNLMMNVCDRIAVINFGSKIAEGLPKEIQNNPEVIRAYLGE